MRKSQKSADTVIDVVDVQSVTPEQEQVLREKFRQEMLAEEADEKAAEASEEWIFTNPHARRSTILPDLRIRTGSESSAAEAFRPGETKDLSKRHRIKDLKRSQSLEIQKERGMLVKGRAPLIRQPLDPIADMATLRPTGTFEDPMSGKRYYDLKLAADIEKNGPLGSGLD